MVVVQVNMSLIEGIGDEVTFFVAVITIIIVMAVAWMSTRVDAMPYTSIVIIDRDRFVDLLRRLRGLSSSTATNAPHRTVPSSSTASLVTGETVIASENLVELSSNETVVDSRSRESVRSQEISSIDNDASSSQDTLAAAPASCNVESALLSNESPTSHQSPDQPSSSASNLYADDIASNKVQIRLQYIDGRQQTVLANPDDTIGHLKRLYLFNLFNRFKQVKCISYSYQHSSS